MLQHQTSDTQMATEEGVMKAVPMALAIEETEIGTMRCCVPLRIVRGFGKQETKDLDLIEFTTNHRAALSHFVKQVQVRCMCFGDLLDEFQISATTCIELGE